MIGKPEGYSPCVCVCASCVSVRACCVLISLSCWSVTRCRGREHAATTLAMEVGHATHLTCYSPTVVKPEVVNHPPAPAGDCTYSPQTAPYTPEVVTYMLGMATCSPHVVTYSPEMVTYSPEVVATSPSVTARSRKLSLTRRELSLTRRRLSFTPPSPTRAVASPPNDN